MKQPLLVCCCLLSCLLSGWGQATDSLTNKDAVYQRPFVLRGELGGTSAAIGGYFEGNTNYFATDGISEGFSMELRRFNIFLYASLMERVKFISELEFEHGTEEIALETAVLDLELHPLLIFRAGILLVPLGYFNQNHDGPKWEFIDRPLVSTTIIPSTYSDVGFGVHGKGAMRQGWFTYEVYLLNGLQQDVIENETGRTFLPAGKDPARFGEDNNGSPALSGRLAFKRRKLGEAGLSAYRGAYNVFRLDGLLLDQRRSLTVLAADLNFSAGKLTVLGEAALAVVEAPRQLSPDIGRRQWGFHADLVYACWSGNLLGWRTVTLNGLLRGEFVDYNAGTFAETGGRIADELTALVTGLSLRFTPSTVLRANFRYEWQRDLLGNPAVRTAGFQFGFASYF